LVFGFQNAFAQREEPNCGINAWVTDKDPKGLNVRAQPSLKGKIVKTLKRKDDTDGSIISVYVVGYSNGWLKIGRAENIDGDLLFDDLGWISAKLVETGTKGGEEGYDKHIKLYSAANAKSKKLGMIPSEANVKIAGFKCGWIKVSYEDLTGWIRDTNICGNPVTTCP
ncbi:MAG TPA: SH3 domain-containing protein, partial [Pyrinomonadaceae bacterium]|nr:SH3 domain-containing protein [Pyrinomonadaceae bacterium]